MIKTDKDISQKKMIKHEIKTIYWQPFSCTYVIPENYRDF